MKISVPVKSGHLPDVYGKFAPESEKHNGAPVRSFPITIKDAPEETVTYAVTVLDHDAIPVGGFTWIHWVVANIDGSLTEIPDNASQSGDIAMTLGKNSTAGSLVGNADPQTNQHYVGPQPPDRDHRYTVTVYAIDEKLPLFDGFWLNQMMDAMHDHILAKASTIVMSRAE